MGKYIDAIINDEGILGTVAEAEKEIYNLRVENERLQSENTKLWSWYNDEMVEPGVSKELFNLREENERLRKAEEWQRKVADTMLREAERYCRENDELHRLLKRFLNP